MADPAVSIRWDRIDLSALVPAPITAVIDTADSVVGTLATVLELATTALEILATVVVGSVDLVRAAILAVVGAINAAIVFFEETQIGISYYVPTSTRNATTVPEMLERFALSYDDSTDPDRPQGATEDTFFVLWFAVVASPSLTDLNETIAPILALFDRPVSSLNLGEDGESQLDLATRTALNNKGKWPPRTYAGEGQAPNWTGMALADLGIVRDVVESLKGVRDSIANIEDQVGQIATQISLIQERAAHMEAQLAAATAAVQTIVDLADQLTSQDLYSLTMSGQGDVVTQQTTIRSATASPDYPLKGRAGEDFCAAFVLHVQAGAAATIQTVRTLFGIKAAASQVVQDEIVAPVTPLNENFRSEGEALEEGWGDG